MNQGPLTPGTAADDASIGTVAWADTDNIKVQDFIYAEAAVSAGNSSHYLIGTNFGFTVPTGATITGILVQWFKQSAGLANSRDLAVRIVKGGALGSQNKAFGVDWNGTEVGYGGDGDLWGETWTPADINAGNFGAAIAAQKSGIFPSSTAQVDRLQITVYFTIPEPGGETDGTEEARRLLVMILAED